MMSQNPQPNQTNLSTSKTTQQPNQTSSPTSQPASVPTQNPQPNQTNLSTSKTVQRPNQTTSPTSQPASVLTQNPQSNQTNLSTSQTTQTSPHNNAKNADRVINHNIMIATWAGVIVSLCTSVYTLWTTKISDQESFKVTAIHRISNAPTEIREVNNLLITSSRKLNDTDFPKGKIAIISVYWEIFISNTSNKDISIVEYNIAQVSNKNEPLTIKYVGLNQGLYSFESEKFSPLSLPITIPEGDTKRIYIKAGLLMDSSAFKLVREQIQKREINDLQDLESLLRAKELDFYGNKVNSIGSGTFRYPTIDQINEQIFGISFKTSRGTKIIEVISWYKYNGMIAE